MASVQNTDIKQKVTQLYNILQDFKPRPKRDDRQVPALQFSPARRVLDINELVADYKAGWSLQQLADKNGICRETVTLQLRKAGVVIRERGCNVRRN